MGGVGREDRGAGPDANDCAAAAKAPKPKFKAGCDASRLSV